jgi:Tfp pilus assembly protein PilO
MAQGTYLVAVHPSDAELRQVVSEMVDQGKACGLTVDQIMVDTGNTHAVH